MTDLMEDARVKGPTEKLASHVADLSYDSLATNAVQKTKQLIRDGIGNQLGASVIAEPAKVALGLLTEFGGAEQATVTGYGHKLPVPFAALANSMLGHGIELDDAHGPGLSKSGSVLIPSVMTTGEFVSRSGRDTIVAAAAGYEVMIRIALAITPGHRLRGFHTTGTVGAIASAAAASKQLGLDSSQVASALGLGAMQSAGVQAYLDDPCMAKPFSPGKASFNGTLAALLTKRGFTGPRRGLESSEGFFNAYAGDVSLDAIGDGLGSEFKVLEVGFKPHAACRYAHGPIDAAQALRANEEVKLDEVACVRVRMCGLAIRQSGRTEVPNLNAAMGSTPFGVALALARGENGLTAYREGFSDQRLHDISRTVELVEEPEFGEMGRQAIVEVTLQDGTVLQHRVEGPKGEPDNPMTDDELTTKFLGLAELAVGRSRAEELNGMLTNLEDLTSLRDLTAALRA